MGYIIQNFNKKRHFLCNVTHKCIKFFTKSIQIMKKKKKKKRKKKKKKKKHCILP